MTEGYDNQQAPEENAERTPQNRRRAVWFVVVFAFVALAMLTSYRYAVNTRVNDWYLFQAATHTAWVLDKINDAEVEPHQFGKHDPRKMRASITAWLEGREEATEVEIAAADTHPLTPWERWSYRALETRRVPKSRVNGPRVLFVLRHGVSSRITFVSSRINIIESDPTLSAEEKRSRLAPFHDELRQLREKQRALRENDARDETLMFSFILVPECGAIEIMAIFLAAVMAFPASWRKRFWGVVVGTPIMYTVNIFRLTVLAVIGAVDQSQGRVWFSLAHEYVWQAVYIVFVVAVWLIWVEYVVKGKRS